MVNHPMVHAEPSSIPLFRPAHSSRSFSAAQDGAACAATEPDERTPPAFDPDERQALALRIARTIRGQTAEDADLAAKVATLCLCGHLSANAVETCLEAVYVNRPANRAAYFHTCLNAQPEVAGTLNELLATVVGRNKSARFRRSDPQLAKE